MSSNQTEIYTWDVPLNTKDISFMTNHTDDEIDEYMSLVRKQKEDNLLQLINILGKYGKSGILKMLNLIPLNNDDSKLPVPFNCIRYRIECKQPSDNFFITKVNIYYTIEKTSIITIRKIDNVLKPKSKIKK